MAGIKGTVSMDADMSLASLEPLQPLQPLNSSVRQRPLSKSVKHLSQQSLATYNQMRSQSIMKLKHVRSQAQNRLKQGFEEARAEAEEFITSPHLLFRPAAFGFFALFPLVLPLAFVPVHVVALYLLFCLVWYLLCVAYVACEVAMRPPWYRYPGLPQKGNPAYWGTFIRDPMADCGQPFLDVTICKKSRIGLTGASSSPCEDPLKCKHFKLSGWLISNAASQDGRFVVCIHGAGRDRRAFLRHLPVFYAKGYNVLLFDLSEHGQSDGSNRGFSFGVREASDVRAVVQYLRDQHDARKVVLVGTSTGATAAILAVAQMDDTEASHVTAIIAENPFSRPADLFCHHLENSIRNYLSQNEHHVWRRIVFFLFSRVLLLRLGLVFNSGAEDAVASIKTPLLVLHSRADVVVPFSHGERVFAAAANSIRKKFVAVDDADHCGLFAFWPALWEKEVSEFLDA
ncbi:Protein ABHD12B [Porphyridium purpureum]|uniref:Protein ABHD12B n=1 Tax=Porphyridium purpureum TaxID=35688 RepID=A0A5J4YZC0_PORPP|nr:Protein ABHD12B [Porphyridium purpureum]|eukprot:POR6687..scf208_2